MNTYQTALAALADPTREAIVSQLRKAPRSVGALAAGLPVSRPAVSQHLKVLRQARLVRERRDGTKRIYSIDPQGLQALRDQFDRLWGDVLEAFHSAAELESTGDKQ